MQAGRPRKPPDLTDPAPARSGRAGRWRRSLLASVFLVTLWAGLDPKEYRFRNEVEPAVAVAGLRFGHFGRVHTEPFLTRELAESLNHSGFTIDLVFVSPSGPVSGFPVLAALHAGQDRTQLLVGMWRRHVIVMQGDDFAHRLLLPRLTADTSTMADQAALLTVVSAPDATRLYLNGRQVDASPALRLRIPVEPSPARLVLGNSVGASQPWTGDIGLFSLLPRACDESEVADRYTRWRANGERALPESSRPLLLYHLAEARAGRIPNRGAVGEPLQIPDRLYALGNRALAGPIAMDFRDRLMVRDAILNLIGFVPLGFAFSMALSPRIHRRSTLVGFSVAAGLGLSLLIELSQTCIPTRDSSLRDLLLNGAGAALGAALWCLAPARVRRLPRSEETRTSA